MLGEERVWQGTSSSLGIQEGSPEEVTSGDLRKTTRSNRARQSSAEGKRLILEAAVGVARALERGRVVGVRRRWSATLRDS